MKLLKRKILFTLASEVDFFSPRVDFDYYPYLFLYWRLKSFKKSSIRDACLQLVKSGEVDKITRNQKVYFRLTSQGRSRLLSFFPISTGQKKVWDRVWRFVIFPKPPISPLPPFDLRRLRQTLRRLGFKKLSRGVYLTPLPISGKLNELLLEKKFPAKITVIESRKLLLSDDKQLAKQTWPLEKMQKEYQNLITKQKSLLKRLKSQKGLNQQTKEQFSLILDNFFSLLEKDPGLPRKLLFDDWAAFQCQETLLKLTQMIKSN